MPTRGSTNSENPCKYKDFHEFKCGASSTLIMALKALYLLCFRIWVSRIVSQNNREEAYSLSSSSPVSKSNLATANLVVNIC